MITFSVSIFLSILGYKYEKEEDEKGTKDRIRIPI